MMIFATIINSTPFIEHFLSYLAFHICNFIWSFQKSLEQGRANAFILNEENWDLKIPSDLVRVPGCSAEDGFFHCSKVPIRKLHILGYCKN